MWRSEDRLEESVLPPTQAVRLAQVIFFTEGVISLAIFDVCEQLLLISLHQVQSEMSVERMLEPGSGNLVLVRVREFC